MCGDCFLTGFTRFPSYWEFESFEAELLNRTSCRKMLLAPHSKARNTRDPEAVYQCQSCHEKWALSSPDNAWRGYFLPEEQVASFNLEQRRKDRIRSFLEGTFLLALVVFAFWMVLK